MQDKEGGTYTPDTQEDEDSIGSARLRPLGAAKTEQAPLTLIISGIFLVILLLLVVIFYNSKLSNNNRLPSELGAEVGPYKDTKVIEAKPINEDDLINTAASSDAATKLAPDAQAPSSVTPTSASSAAAASQTPPVVNAAAAPEIQAALTPKTAPQPVPAAQPPALKPAVSTPAPKPPVAAAPKPVTPAPVAVAKPAPTPVAAAPKPAVTGGGAYAVQIGAFGSDAIANQQLGAIAQPSGASKAVEKVDVNGKTYYRASFKGFASKDQAKAFCDKLKGAGKTCFVK